MEIIFIYLFLKNKLFVLSMWKLTLGYGINVFCVLGWDLKTLGKTKDDNQKWRMGLCQRKIINKKTQLFFASTQLKMILISFCLVSFA
jgi:hypothetical protein